MIQVSSPYVYQRVIYGFALLISAFCVIVALPNEQQDPRYNYASLCACFPSDLHLFFKAPFLIVFSLFCFHTSILLQFSFLSCLCSLMRVSTKES